MFNEIILIGRLGKDPDLKFTPGGAPVGTLRLCVDTKFKQGNESKTETLFIDCVLFGKTAENAAEYLGKGDPVLIQGRLRERRWDSQGVQKSKFEVVGEKMKFLPRGSSGDNGGQGQKGSHGTSDMNHKVSDDIHEIEPF